MLLFVRPGPIIRSCARVSALVAFALGPWGCQEATQARVTVHTNVAATSELRAAVWVQGRTPDISDVPTTQISPTWDQSGLLGDLVAVPGDQRAGAQVRAVAVLARGVDPQACLGAPTPAACAVSRRSFTYQANARITVPLGLYRQCFGVTCSADQSCNYQGRCVSAQVDPSTCGSESGCIVEGEPPVPPGVEPMIPAPSDGGIDAAALGPPTVSFRDGDPRRGFALGRLLLSAPMQLAPISGYRVYWLGATGQRLGVAKEWPNGAGDKTWDLLPGTELPKGAETLEAVAVDVDGQRESSAARVRADNYPRAVDLELDLGNDVSFNSEPFLAQGPDGSQVLLAVGINSSNRATIRRCAGDGALCTRHDLGGPGRYGIHFATAQAAMHQNQLYVAETDPDGAVLLHICPQDLRSCVTRTLAPAGTRTDSYSSQFTLDTVRGRVVLVTVEPGVVDTVAPKSMIYRCDLDGTNCSRRELPMPITSDAAITTDPDNGDLVMIATNRADTKRTLQLRRCNAVSNTCSTKEIDEVLPVHERCFVSMDMIPGRSLLASVQVGGCDEVRPRKASWASAAI